MTELKSLNLCLSPSEFFKQQVSTAIFKQKIDVEPEIEFYLVNLLCSFIDPSKSGFITEDEQSLLDIPLAIQLKNALEAPNEKRPKLFKNLGDTSLYVAGYFQDYFNRKAFDIDYFMTLGSNAYESLGNLTKDRDDTLAHMYFKLSSQFSDFVEVYAFVSDQIGFKSPQNILATYDRWTRNQNSIRLRKILEDHGIVPIPNQIKIAQ